MTEKNQKHIAIAGGTGFVGEGLVNYFLEKKYVISVISRDKNKIKKKFANKVNALSWDDSDSEIKSKLKNCIAIINLSGKNVADKRWNNKIKKELVESRLKSAEKVLSWQKLLKPQPQILAAGAISIYGCYPNINKIFKESDKTTNQKTCLSQISLSMEDLYKKHTKKVTLMRFALVMNPAGGLMKKFLPLYKLCLGSKIGDGKQPWTWITRYDLIRAIEFCIENKITGPVNMVAPESLTQAQFSSALAKSLNRPNIMLLPKTLLKIMFGYQMATELFLLGTAAYPEVLIKNNFKFKYPEIKKYFNKS